MALIAKEGIPFVAAPFVLAAIFFILGFWIVAMSLSLLSVFMMFFFRDPERTIPSEPNLIVSAADGKVTRIEKRVDGNFVSVFLSPFDVHINRAPIGGSVVAVREFKGKKAPATSNSASTTNERKSLTIEGSDATVICTQIVGILARRIVCFRKKGDSLERGERFGLIKFGSRTDLLMPKNTEIRVAIGDRVRGGETIIAKVIE